MVSLTAGVLAALPVAQSRRQQGRARDQFKAALSANRSQGVCVRAEAGVQKSGWEASEETLQVRPDQSAQDAPKNGQPQSTENETYDVYVSSPQRLQEGIRKHTISVFVADESGIINRVAGVFARRGMNIESLAVGLNVDKALFTVVVNGSPSQVANMVKQLAKLVKVRYVDDVTDMSRIDRELAFYKIRAPHGSRRSEILELTSIFRAKVVDVGPAGLTIALSGDPGKLYAFEQAVRPFGLAQLARTGRITLQKSDTNLDMGGHMTYSTGASTARAARDEAANVEPSPSGTDGADVYIRDTRPKTGPWTVQNVLSPIFDANTPKGFQAHTVLVEVEDNPGVLNEVTGVIARRGYNIQSLAVGTSETPGFSRITTVLPGQRGGVSKLIKQLEKLVVVQNVQDLTNVPHVARELMLVKVRCTAAQRSEIKDVVEIIGGSVAYVTLQTMTIEMIAGESKMQNLQEILAPYGILEVARTGRIALERESRVDSTLLQGSQLGRYV